MNSELEQLLVKKAQAGDKQALSELWDNITPKLFGYLFNVMKNRELAEDLLQTTWLKATAALPRYKQQRSTPFSAWLFAIARNECNLHWRKSQRETAYIENNSHSDSSAHTFTVNNSDNNLMVEQILSQLSEEDQELIRLRYIADLPVNDIARILNINFVTVRVRLHRALNKMRNNLNS